MNYKEIIKSITKENTLAHFIFSDKNSLNYKTMLNNGTEVKFSIPFIYLKNINYNQEMNAKDLIDWINIDGESNKILKKDTENSKVVGKYLIVKDLNFSDFFKNEDGVIKPFENYIDALQTAGIYECEDVLILKIESNC